MRPAATLIRGSYFAEIAGIFSFCALLILGCMREQLKREKAKIVSHLDLAIIHDIKQKNIFFDWLQEMENFGPSFLPTSCTLKNKGSDHWLEG